MGLMVFLNIQVLQIFLIADISPVTTG